MFQKSKSQFLELLFALSCAVFFESTFRDTPPNEAADDLWPSDSLASSLILVDNKMTSSWTPRGRLSKCWTLFPSLMATFPALLVDRVHTLAIVALSVFPAQNTQQECSERTTVVPPIISHLCRPSCLFHRTKWFAGQTWAKCLNMPKSSPWRYAGGKQVTPREV